MYPRYAGIQEAIGRTCPRLGLLRKGILSRSRPQETSTGPMAPDQLLHAADHPVCVERPRIERLALR
jgi:hypothetical protein